MNNLSSYCGLVDARISASEKDLPVYNLTCDIFSGMPIHTLSPNANVIKFQENSRQNKEETDDPFKPKSGHVPGGLPMISDSAFSLTILIYVSVAFLLVFFLFCWKTNGNGTVGSSEETLKQQCPLMTNNPPEPNVIPPTPTKMIEDFD